MCPGPDITAIRKDITRQQERFRKHQNQLSTWQNDFEASVLHHVGDFQSNLVNVFFCVSQPPATLMASCATTLGAIPHLGLPPTPAAGSVDSALRFMALRVRRDKLRGIDLVMSFR